MRTFLLLLPILFFGCNNDTPLTDAVSTPNTPQQTEVAIAHTPEQTPPPAAATPQVKATPTSLSGESLYKRKCASCHGLNAQKSALGKSRIIATWSSEQIANAVNGYRAGSYGKSMKALMQAQVRDLSPEDIDVLAHYISALN